MRCPKFSNLNENLGNTGYNRGLAASAAGTEFGRISIRSYVFEPFSISCTTCRASLRVRKPDAMGQILACPKCSGMVLVKRPVEVASDQVDSKPIQSSRRVTSVAPILPAAAESNYEAISDILDSPASGQPVAGDSQVADSTQTVGVAAADLNYDDVDDLSDESQLAPSANLSSSRLQRQRAALMYTFAGISGIGLAIAVAVMLRSGQGAPSATQPAALSASLSPSAPPTRNSSTEIADTTTDTDTPDKFSTDSPVVTTLRPELPEVVSVETSEVVVQPEEMLLAANDPDASSSEPPLPTDIPDSDLRDDETAVDNFADIAPSLPSEPATVDLPNLPEEFMPYDSALNVPARPPIIAIDVAAQMKHEFGFESDGTKLEDFLKFLSTASTIPITIDADALRYSRMSPAARVKVAENGPIHKVLDAALRPAHLGYRIEPGHLIIERARKSNDLILSKHAFTDIIESGVSAEMLTAMIARLVSPNDWKGPSESLDRLKVMDVPGYIVEEGYVVMRQSERAHFETVFLRERLRVSRGLAPRSQFEEDELVDDWRQRSQLSQIVAPRSPRQLTLGNVIRELDRVSRNVRILVDWHALAPIGWEASSDVAGYQLEEESLSELLDQLTRRSGLAYRCVGNRIVEITSAAAANTKYELAIHPIDDLMDDGHDPNELIPNLQRAIGTQFFKAGQGTGAIVYDDSTQSLIVRLPQSGQVAFDWLLRSVRGS